MERQRIRFTKDQRFSLERTFQMIPFPHALMRELIAKSLGLTEKQVKGWFKRRQKEERTKNSRQKVNQDQNRQVEERKEDSYQNVNQDQNRQVEENKEDSYQKVNPNLEGRVYSQTELNDKKIIRMDRQNKYFTEDQRLSLERAFQTSQNVCALARKQIAESLGLTEEQVKNWFGNRRFKERRKYSHQNINQDRNCPVEEKIDWYQNVNQDQNRHVEEKKEDSYQNVNPYLERIVFSQAEVNDIINREKIARSIGLTEKQVKGWYINRRRQKRKKNSRQNVNQDQNRQVEERKEDSYQNVNPNLEECVYHQAEPSDIINRMQIAESFGLTRRQFKNWFGNRRMKERKKNSCQNVNQDQNRQVEERKEDSYQNVNQDQNRQVEENKEDSYQKVNPNLEGRVYSQTELNDVIDRLLCTSGNSKNCSSYQNYLSESYAVLYFNT
ncbi:hypothetical protein KQX54_014751 [Cotesia glomerata]|uniref:Homeobox domain-containing protein n=1 Tax=Cotesia glomerata TaxID=32391 RepID=A0AAV7IQY4_COTGL|nr:hypothetical protein KQX54_014751 [Cotesia glomerata]